MAGLCTTGLTMEDTESPIIMKILWGCTTGVLCIMTVCFAGIDGIKQLCNDFGFVNSIMMFLWLGSWLKIMKNPSKYDIHKEDYDADGKPIKSVRQPWEGYDPNKKVGPINKLTGWHK